MKKLLSLILAMVMILGLSAATVHGAEMSAPKKTKIVTDGDLILATTTSTQDSGLLTYLLPYFEKLAKIKVKVIAVGSGEAIAMGNRGDADVLLVHSRAAEDAFVSSGNGMNRQDVMYNFYYLVGPLNDPAKVSTVGKAAEGMKLINGTGSTFISRADKSGTHTKELSLWKASGYSPSGNSWYKETGQGMLDTLLMANELKGYTLTDSGTWAANKAKLTDLKIVLKGDSALYNPYGVIAVNPANFKGIHSKSAKAFIDFLISKDGQTLIANYKKNGSALFVPSYNGK